MNAFVCVHPTIDCITLSKTRITYLAVRGFQCYGRNWPGPFSCQAPSPRSQPAMTAYHMTRRHPSSRSRIPPPPSPPTMEALVTSLDSKYPCRTLQLFQLAALLNPVRSNPHPQRIMNPKLTTCTCKLRTCPPHHQSSSMASKLPASPSSLKPSSTPQRRHTRGLHAMSVLQLAISPKR